MLAEAQSAFIAHMKAQVPGWDQSEPVRELLATADLARGQAMEAEGTLEGMNDPKDFQQAKKDGLILPLPSGNTVIERASKPVTAGAARPATGSQSPASRRPVPGLRFVEGQAVMLDDFKVRIVSNVRDGDDTAMVDIDGDIEEVTVGELTPVPR